MKNFGAYLLMILIGGVLATVAWMFLPLFGATVQHGNFVYHYYPIGGLLFLIGVGFVGVAVLAIVLDIRAWFSRLRNKPRS